MTSKERMLFRIEEWALKKHFYEYEIIDRQEESYFSVFDNTKNISEYSFNTVPQMMDILIRDFENPKYYEDIIEELCRMAFCFKPSSSTPLADVHSEVSPSEYIYTI